MALPALFWPFLQIRMRLIWNYQTVSEDEFSEVHGRKRPTGRGGIRHTAAWWHHFGV
jgi:hypothetical protein